MKLLCRIILCILILGAFNSIGIAQDSVSITLKLSHTSVLQQGNSFSLTGYGVELFHESETNSNRYPWNDIELVKLERSIDPLDLLAQLPIFIAHWNQLDMTIQQQLLQGIITNPNRFTAYEQIEWMRRIEPYLKDTDSLQIDLELIQLRAYRKLKLIPEAKAISSTLLRRTPPIQLSNHMLYQLSLLSSETNEPIEAIQWCAVAMERLPRQKDLYLNKLKALYQNLKKSL